MLSQSLCLNKVKLGQLRDLSDSEAIKILSKLYKQRLETAEVYKSQSRENLAEDELAQAKVLSEYLPSALNDSEIESKVIEIISELGRFWNGRYGQSNGHCFGSNGWSCRR